MLLIFINGCSNSSNSYDDNEPVEEEIEPELEDSVVVFKPFVENIVAEDDYKNDPEQFFEDAGKPCTDDCSGHIAGYKWAERKEIMDSDDCGGNSQSFIDGCVAYVEQL
jgi:hypothetical protein